MLYSIFFVSFFHIYINNYKGHQKIIGHIVTKKERVRDHTVLWLPARPLAPMCFLIFCTRFTPPNHTTPRLPTDSHRRPSQDQRYTSALLWHHYSTEFTQVPAKEILSLQAIHIARKHKHDPHQLLTNHQTSGSIYSLSL
jgi:hypothetical protein